MQKCVLLILFFLLSYSISHGNTPTTDTLSVDSLESRPAFFKRMYKNVYRYFTEANQEKETKRFDFSVIGGPHFSSDTKLGLGLVASGLYRVDREHLTLPPSNISFYGDVTTTGFYLLGIRGTTIFKEDKYRLGINFYFFSFPSKSEGSLHDLQTPGETNPGGFLTPSVSQHLSGGDGTFQACQR